VKPKQCNKCFLPHERMFTVTYRKQSLTDKNWIEFKIKTMCLPCHLNWVSSVADDLKAQKIEEKKARKSK
jgi:hypothetical protein